MFEEVIILKSNKIIDMTDFAYLNHCVKYDFIKLGEPVNLCNLYEVHFHSGVTLPLTPEEAEEFIHIIKARQKK